MGTSAPSELLLLHICSVNVTSGSLCVPWKLGMIMTHPIAVATMLLPMLLLCMHVAYLILKICKQVSAVSLFHIQIVPRPRSTKCCLFGRWNGNGRTCFPCVDCAGCLASLLLCLQSSCCCLHVCHLVADYSMHWNHCRL